MMKSFVAGEIEDFLRALDRQLEDPFRLVVIGGAAAALSFETTSGTFDIDAVNDVSSLEQSSKAARAETGLDRDVFLRRMAEEMTHVAPRKRLFDQFLVMMEELYGPDEADRMGASLKAKWGTLEDR